VLVGPAGSADSPLHPAAHANALAQQVARIVHLLRMGS
jgi:hypothetical protein